MKFNREMVGKWSILPLILLACQVHAGESDAPKPAGVATFGQLDALRSQNAMLAEELKNAELKNKIKGGGSSPSNMGSLPGFPGMVTQPPAVPFQSGPAAAPAPKAAAEPAAPAFVSADVQMVSSDREGRLVALLSLQNGRQVKARVGSTIPGVGTVQRISVDEVVVWTPKGKAISLPFGSEPANLPAPNIGVTPMPMMGMPSLSTVMPPLPRGGR